MTNQTQLPPDFAASLAQALQGAQVPVQQQQPLFSQSLAAANGPMAVPMSPAQLMEKKLGRMLMENQQFKQNQKGNVNQRPMATFKI
jgi:hypothetical protein